jgi:hypothetical protein
MRLVIVGDGDRDIRLGASAASLAGWEFAFFQPDLDAEPAGEDAPRKRWMSRDKAAKFEISERETESGTEGFRGTLAECVAWVSEQNAEAIFLDLAWGKDEVQRQDAQYGALINQLFDYQGDPEIVGACQMLERGRSRYPAPMINALAPALLALVKFVERNHAKKPAVLFRSDFAEIGKKFASGFIPQESLFTLDSDTDKGLISEAEAILRRLRAPMKPSDFRESAEQAAGKLGTTVHDWIKKAADDEAVADFIAKRFLGIDTEEFKEKFIRSHTVVAREGFYFLTGDEPVASASAIWLCAIAAYNNRGLSDWQEVLWNDSATEDLAALDSMKISDSGDHGEKVVELADLLYEMFVQLLPVHPERVEDKSQFRQGSSNLKRTSVERKGAEPSALCFELEFPKKEDGLTLLNCMHEHVDEFIGLSRQDGGKRAMPRHRTAASIVSFAMKWYLGRPATNPPTFKRLFGDGLPLEFVQDGDRTFLRWRLLR